MTCGITGASGHLGSGILRYCLDRVAAGELVAVTRQPAKMAAVAARGVEVREGDFDKPGLEQAFRGIDRLLIIPGSDLMPDVRPRQHRAAVAAAVAAGVRHIVYVSSVGARPGPPDGILETHWATEQAVIQSGVPWTLIRMNIYADFLANHVKSALSTGVYAAPAGAPYAYVVRDDLAAAAAAVLTTSGHEGVTYHATGPVSVTHAEVAAAVSRAAGKPVQFSPLTLEQWQAGLVTARLPPALVDVLTRSQRAGSAGAFDLVTGDIGRLTGRRSQSALEFVSTVLVPSAAVS
ncbi:MAG TPA: NAD(P)H-binding protein [Vicinamibacterales bacterium]|jgi:NAD(P)H dehydrogenase (quinone)